MKSDPTHNFILSPEEDQDMEQIRATQKMKICMYLDEFFDVVFEIDGSYIKANSFVLKNRNEYFEAMFSSRFKESKDAALIQKQGNNEFRLIKVMGVPKIFFNCIYFK